MCASAQITTEKSWLDSVRHQANTLACFSLNFDDRRTNMIKKIFTTLMATMFLTGLFGAVAGCNTVEGAGKDIQQGGQAITEEAREHK